MVRISKEAQRAFALSLCWVLGQGGQVRNVGLGPTGICTVALLGHGALNSCSMAVFPHENASAWSHDKYSVMDAGRRLGRSCWQPPPVRFGHAQGALYLGTLGVGLCGRCAPGMYQEWEARLCPALLSWADSVLHLLRARLITPRRFARWVHIAGEAGWRSYFQQFR